MFKDIYAALKPIALLLLVILMFTGFLAVKTKPVQAWQAPSCSPTPTPILCPAEQDCPNECHTDTRFVDDGDCGEKECLPNAPAAETCPTECGYPGGTVSDDRCGTKDCSATDPCENGPTSTPTPTPTPATDQPRGGGPSTPSCGAMTPDAPYLVSATTTSSVKLVWQKVLSNATHYTISYGPSSGNYLWGVPNAGNTNNYLINGVSSGCFIVYAVNDCAPSAPSNEVCTGAVGGVAQVLGLSDTSNDSVQGLFFWSGLVMIVFGTRLIGREASGKISA